MAGIIDYIGWRGDIPFTTLPPCDVDWLVFSRIAYLPLEGIVPSSFGVTVTVGEISAALVGGDGGQRTGEKDTALLRAVGGSARFAPVRACGFLSLLDEEKQEQFAALTFLLPDGSALAAFRGTDGSLVGWKEDFNMVFDREIPSQTDAVAYLARLAGEHSGALRTAGHSKGGNLALYSAAFCPERVRQRVISAVSLDGPGFSDETVASEEYRAILPFARTYLPQSSVVGMLLGHAEQFTVVRSDRSGILQHDLYSWQIMGGSFVTLDDVTAGSQLIDATLKSWISAMQPSQRERFVEGLYAVISASDSATVRELFSGRGTVAVLRAAVSLDDRTRADIVEALTILRKTLRRELSFVWERDREGD